MLLRRVIEHVKAQNWTAVALDFVIVVAGILIAFRITEWSEARNEAKEEHLALERLQLESEEAVRYFRDMVADRAEDNAKRTEAIAALTAGSLESFDRSRVEDGVFSLGHYPAIAPNRSTYDELNASGMVTRISNQAVRDSVASYISELNFIESQLLFFRQGSQRDEEYSGSAFGYVYDPTSEFTLKRRMDFAALAANDAYVLVVGGMLRNQIVFQFYRRSVLREAEEMCRALSEALGKKCAPLEESE